MKYLNYGVNSSVKAAGIISSQVVTFNRESCQSDPVRECQIVTTHVC